MRVSGFLLLIFALLASACVVSQPAATPTPEHPTMQTPLSTATLASTPTRTLQPTRALPLTQTPAATDTSAPPATDTHLPSRTPTLGLPVTRTPASAAQCPKPGEQTSTLSFIGPYQDYSPQIQEYLNARGSIVGLEEALNQLTVSDDSGTAWQKRVQAIASDVTGDSTPDMIVELVFFATGTTVSGGIYIFVCQEGRFERSLVDDQADQGIITGLNFSGASLDPGIGLRAIQDMNRDGVPEIVFSYIRFFHDTEVIGLHDNFVRDFFIVEWDGERFASLLPFRESSDSPVYVTNGDGEIRDTNGDGILELVLSFGPARSPETSRTYRPGTRIWSWNGHTFILTCSEQSVPPLYRFQAVEDGDDATACGHYDKALASYQQVIFDEQLLSWSDLQGSSAPDPNERPTLSAYARYRILLLHVAQGNLREARIVYTTLQEKFPSGAVGYPYTELATIFWKTYDATKKVATACEKAVEYAAIHAEEILTPLRSNTTRGYTAQDICLFR